MGCEKGSILRVPNYPAAAQGLNAKGSDIQIIVHQGSTLRPARLPGAGKNFKYSVQAGDFDIVPARQGR